MRMNIVPTALIDTIRHNCCKLESEVLVLPVHLVETRHVSFQSRQVLREMRHVSQDRGNLLLSSTVPVALEIFYLTLVIAYISR